MGKPLTWKTDDDALKFKLHRVSGTDVSLDVEDTDTNDSIVLAVDADGLDEVIKILEKAKKSMVSVEKGETIIEEDEDSEEDEEEDEDGDEDEEDEEEEDDGESE